MALGVLQWVWDCGRWLWEFCSGYGTVGGGVGCLAAGGVVLWMVDDMDVRRWGKQFYRLIILVFRLEVRKYDQENQDYQGHSQEKECAA